MSDQGVPARQSSSSRGLPCDVSHRVLPIQARDAEERIGELRAGRPAAALARNLSTDKDGKALNTNIPQDTLKLFTTYRIAAIGNGLTVGGGLRWQNQTHSDNQGSLGVRFTQGSYSVVDLMARYAITRNVSATFNLYNLFDKRYYTSTSSSFYGTPRSFRLGLNVSY